ncbi:hypothetical protein KC614_00460 [candidate division WWE3 bacterium]|uniref:Uncharacterized protein n=1 Tax=candidate division WWE3 bacterium TaxID=2053526 RepID=A0A955RQI0_UNCKA|nr:hypothetical protein [candidate division WWE3 bacterium]
MAKGTTIRVNSSPNLLQRIKEIAQDSKELDNLSGSFWKPVGTDIKNFHPKNSVVRLRTFPDGRSKAQKIDVLTNPDGSYDTRDEVIPVQSRSAGTSWWRLITNLGSSTNKARPNTA